MGDISAGTDRVCALAAHVAVEGRSVKFATTRARGHGVSTISALIIVDATQYTEYDSLFFIQSSICMANECRLQFDTLSCYFDCGGSVVLRCAYRWTYSRCASLQYATQFYGCNYRDGWCSHLLVDYWVLVRRVAASIMAKPDY